MKKKIKDLTLEEIKIKICPKYGNCDECPLCDAFGGSYNCLCPVLCYINKHLEREVEVDE